MSMKIKKGGFTQHQKNAALFGAGFTLIEALVAVAIVALSVGGPLYAASRALVAAQLSSERLTASYLAQEGIEHVRTSRDNKYLSAYQQGIASPGIDVSSFAWFEFIYGPAKNCAGSTCKLDPWDPAGEPTLSVCTGASCTLYRDGNGRYTPQNTGTVTPFARMIKVVPISADNHDRKVISTVSWSNHGRTYSVEVVDILTPWQ